MKTVGAISEYTLDANGLTVLLLPEHSAPVVTGPKPKQLLIRGVGPTLASFGVAGTLADPTLAIFNAASQQVAANDDWGSAANLTDLRAATTAAGAFVLAEASKDSALLVTLDPGVYSAQVNGVAGLTGVSLLEIYEVP